MKLKDLYEHALKKNIPNNVYTNLSLLETDNYLIAINSQSFNNKFNYWDTTNNLFKYHVGVGNNIGQIPKRKDFRTILSSEHFDDYTKIINKLKPPLDLSYFSLYKWYNSNIDYFKFLETSELFAADLAFNNITSMPFPIQDELTDLLDRVLNKNYFGYSSWDIVPNEDVCDSIILELETSGRIVHNNVEKISFQIPIKMIKHKHLAADSLSVMYKSFVQTSSSLSFNKLEHHTSDVLSVNVLYISK